MKTALARTKLLASALIVITVMGCATYYLQDRSVTHGLLEGPEYSEKQLNEGGVNGIRDLPLSEAKKRLNYLILSTRHGINSISMLESMRLEIGPATTRPGDQVKQKELLRYMEPFEPLPAAERKAILTDLTRTSGQFQQFFFDNASVLKLEVEAIHEVLKRGALPDQQTEASYRIQTLYFRDGSQQPFAEVAIMDEDSEEQDQDTTQPELKLNKPLERISLALTYQAYPSFNKIVLDRAHPRATTEGGEVYQLTHLGDASASLQMATPKSKSYVIQGLTADGKTLYERGRSSKSSLNAEQRANQRAYYNELLRMADNFAYFKSAAAVQDHLEQFASNLPRPDGELRNVQTSYQFEDTPASIVIYVLDPLQPQTLDWEMHNSIDPSEHYIAYDIASKRWGFIDSKGQWVVKPRFKGVDTTGIPGVYRLMVGETSRGMLLFKYFVFVPGTQTLKELPFESISMVVNDDRTISSVINDDLIMVQREDNGPYGVYDLKTLQFVVPMKYINPSVIGNVFVGRPGEKTYGVRSLYGAWSLSGKELLTPRYSAINGSGEFIYATSADQKQTDVYNLQMKKLNPHGATVFGQFVQGQPLLIQNRGSRKKSFINEQGKALPWSLPFDDVNQFSNGMAVVKKGSRYGAIDVHGKLRLPVIYRKLGHFQKNLASAEMDGFNGLVLIDKNNRVVKKLGPFLSVGGRISYNSNDNFYHIMDHKVTNWVTVFDADGNQTDSYEHPNYEHPNFERATEPEGNQTMDGGA